MDTIKITPLTTSQAVHDVFTPDVRAKRYNQNYDPSEPYESEEYTALSDHDPLTDQMVDVFSCNKTLAINIQGQIVTTSDWFITSTYNELIYDIDKNDWINLTMFDEGYSVCKGIALIDAIA